MMTDDGRERCGQLTKTDNDDELRNICDRYQTTMADEDGR